jgi:hypothetical protein
VATSTAYTPLGYIRGSITPLFDVFSSLFPPCVLWTPDLITPHILHGLVTEPDDTARKAASRGAQRRDGERQRHISVESHGWCSARATDSRFAGRDASARRLTSGVAGGGRRRGDAAGAVAAAAQRTTKRPADYSWRFASGRQFALLVALVVQG